jgi:hypothetical protein
MNLPKQARPVMRDVSRDPIGARVEGAQPEPPNPWLNTCLQFCYSRPPGEFRDFCIQTCYGTYGHG